MLPLCELQKNFEYVKIEYSGGGGLQNFRITKVADGPKFVGNLEELIAR